MSEENVQFVRNVWEVNVTQGVEAVLPDITEDCVLEDFPELPDHAVYVGREGALEIYRNFREMWGELVQEPVGFIDVSRGYREPPLSMQSAASRPKAGGFFPDFLRGIRSLAAASSSPRSPRP